MDRPELDFSEPLRIGSYPTNNRAEIEAAIRAIDRAKEAGIEHLEVRTDSRYLVESQNSWGLAWQSNGWRTASGSEVVNRETFERLEEALSGINVRFRHEKGHASSRGNLQADTYAKEGAARY